MIQEHTIQDIIRSSKHHFNGIHFCNQQFFFDAFLNISQRLKISIKLYEHQCDRLLLSRSAYHQWYDVKYIMTIQMILVEYKQVQACTEPERSGSVIFSQLLKKTRSKPKKRVSRMANWRTGDIRNKINVVQKIPEREFRFGACLNRCNS